MDVVALLEKLFDETCSSLVFVLDQIVVEGTAVDVQIGLDVPDEVGEAIQTHDFVREPIKSFLTKARKLLPDHQIAVSMFVDCLSETSSKAWRRLEIALVQQGKAKDVYDALAALRVKK